MTDDGPPPLLPEREQNPDRLPSPPHAAGATGEMSPYLPFNLPEPDLKAVPQLDALRADAEIAGYLQDNSPRAWTGRRFARAVIGLALTAAALAAVLFFVPGNALRAYSPPPPRDTPKPQPYHDTAALPILFRDSVREINAEIGDGNRWLAAFDKLDAFIARAKDGSIDPPPEVLLWAEQEMLVILASKEIPPGAHPQGYADLVYGDFRENLPEKTDDPIPFRAGSAYARILAARPLQKDREASAKQQKQLVDLLEQLRAVHPDLLDYNRELLAVEAETHVRLFPKEYVPDDRYLDYHWRRAAHAIVRLYDLYGKRDPGVRQIDRRRWQAVYRYFDLKLFTWDPKKIGRLKSIRLDGAEYSREEIRRILETQ